MFNLREMLESALPGGGQLRKPAPQAQRRQPMQRQVQAPQGRGGFIPGDSTNRVSRGLFDDAQRAVQPGALEDEQIVGTYRGPRRLNSVDPGEVWFNQQGKINSNSYMAPRRYEDGSGFNQMGQPLRAYDDSDDDYTQKMVGWGRNQMF